MDARQTRTLKKIFICSFLAVAGFTNISAIGTKVYFEGWLPREPVPQARRTFPIAGSRGATVYLTATELEWQRFIWYGLVPLEGLGLIGFGIIVSTHKAPPAIKNIPDLWS
jgi:hypothetical protein